VLEIVIPKKPEAAPRRIQVANKDQARKEGQQRTINAPPQTQQ